MLTAMEVTGERSCNILPHLTNLCANRNSLIACNELDYSRLKANETSERIHASSIAFIYRISDDQKFTLALK